MKLAAFLTLAAVVATAPAQTNFKDPANLRGERVRPHDGRELTVDQGSRGLEQILRKLQTRASLMLIVAHPDDEDGGMLTFCSRGLGARVASLTLTRGEGGQNAMTGDFEDALGLLRTQELLSAGRYMGVDQMFGTEVDFGFSKTKEESFAKWTHQRVLYDAVRAVRLYRPMVIAAVFIGGVTDGHGQHQVSGEIAQEVFKAAGDPNVFPDQIAEGLQPWQPLKVYARVPMAAITERGLFDYATGQFAPAKFTNYVTGEVTTSTPSVDVVVHEGNSDPLLSVPGEPTRSYVQFARIGLSQQRSQIGQGMRVPPAGTFDVSYHRYGSRLDAAHQKAREENFFQGIDTSLEGLATPASPKFLHEKLTELSAQIQAAAAAYKQSSDAVKIAPLLAAAWSTTDTLLSRVQATEFSATEKAEAVHELEIKRVQLNDALALALGLTLDGTVQDATQIAGSRPTVTLELHTTYPEDLSASSQWLENAQGTEKHSTEKSDRQFEVSSARRFTRTIATESAFTATVTRPYFERSDVEQPVYQLRNAALRNAPASPPAIVAWETVLFRGVPVKVGRIVHKDQQSLMLVPEISVALDHDHEMLPSGTSSFSLNVHTTSSDAAKGTVHVQAPAGWTARPASQPLTAQAETFAITSAAGEISHAALKISANSQTGGLYSEGYRAVGYGDLPRTNYFMPSTLHVVKAQLALPTHRRIAYVAGTGDGVPEALAALGLKPAMLSVADLNAARLAEFDTVVLGVRTYNAHPELHGAPTRALEAFARNGGNVIVQYQTAEFTSDDAPYPLTLGRDAEKVVDETDPVKLLDASAPVLSTPNRITPADFNGWIEERGHGFLRTWDSHYSTPTETADPGEDPQRGGIATVRLGRGHWTYCAFALYRQLPEAVPGAYRLFANLLGLADAPAQ
ncbi:MAG TPA: PIG-L family deacetylase [Acidobacteriaceae bacterium]|jgi:LmbE family N-acetylglucosaminyl deacetylase